MCQVETKKGVEKAVEIAIGDEVNIIEMAPLDLSANVGYLWDHEHKKVRRDLARGEEAYDGELGGKEEEDKMMVPIVSEKIIYFS